MRTLPNGLRVYSMPDRDTANVSVQVWYDVGSVDDPAGRSGFAHLFEHIMFKSTRNMPEQFFDRLTEAAATPESAEIPAVKRVEEPVVQTVGTGN